MLPRETFFNGTGSTPREGSDPCRRRCRGDIGLGEAVSPASPRRNGEDEGEPEVGLIGTINVIVVTCGCGDRDRRYGALWS